MNRGKLIVIEGTDGTGKETQSLMLVDRLNKEGRPAKYIDFPRYDTPTGMLVRDYLQGKLGPPAEVDPYVASKLYADDRKAAAPMMEEWLSQGNIVVCNRYVSANKGHQGGKTRSPEAMQDFLGWVNSVEYRINKIPREDLVMLLYAPHLIGMNNAKDRAEHKGISVDGHETDSRHMSDAERAYLHIAEVEGWTVLDVSDGNKLHPRELIHDAVYKIVKSKF